jgi:hypothetical protein
MWVGERVPDRTTGRPGDAESAYFGRSEMPWAALRVTVGALRKTVVRVRVFP